ncbi:hypothetical protein ACFVW5_41765, partial [Streptomyces sp. NPDC058232]
MIAYTGLRRGAACGLRGTELDPGNATLTVCQEIVRLGWTTAVGTRESDAGERTIALDTGTVALPEAHRRRQRKARLAHGPSGSTPDCRCRRLLCSAQAMGRRQTGADPPCDGAVRPAAGRLGRRTARSPMLLAGQSHQPTGRA